MPCLYVADHITQLKFHIGMTYKSATQLCRHEILEPGQQKKTRTCARGCYYLKKIAMINHPISAFLFAWLSLPPLYYSAQDCNG